jgi:flagellar motor protein MotB
MPRTPKIAGLMIGFTIALLATGCTDHEARISMLEDANSNLLMENDRLRHSAESAKAELDNCHGSLARVQGRIDSLQQQLADSASNVPEEWTPVPGGAMIAIEGHLLFPAGRVDLRRESESLISKLASQINGSFSDKDIYVFGHTDSDPIKKSGWKDNRELASQRALSVVRRLQAQGVPATRIVACGWGEHRPLTQNTSKEGKSKNRRVEIFAFDQLMASPR